MSERRYSATEIHERLSRYFDICPLTGMPADAFTDPLDFLCHETWKRRATLGKFGPYRRLIEAAFSPDDDSRGIREGLERAAKIVCRWCREGVESRANEFRYWHQFPDGGTTACPATEVRAEASKLEGSERGRKPLTPAPSTGTVSPRVEESNVQTYQG